MRGTHTSGHRARRRGVTRGIGFLPMLGVAVLIMATALAAPACAAAPPAVTTAAVTLSPGPTGWASYRHLDALAQLRSGEQTRQFSSFDRTGGNDDGFDGAYSCLRITDGCVIAERSGAGEISSIWFTRDYGVVRATGWIRIELDGETVLNAQLQDVVDGRLGAPFVWPLVGNGDDTAGGAVIKVPMPYRHSMRVTVQHNPDFYHVDYRVFASGDGVSTFDPGDRAQDVVDRLRAFGLRDPKPAAAGARTSRVVTDVPVGATRRVADITGSGRITQIRLQLPQVSVSPRAGDDGRAFGAGGGSAFTVRIDPANTGVRLVRRFDPMIGNQRATVFVDGQPVGTWSGGPAQPGGSWDVQTLELPASLTAGKSVLHVANRFVSSDLDVNEFRYDVHSRVGGEWTRTDVMDLGPGHPGAEQAHGYTITAPTWQGSRVYRYSWIDPATVSRSDAVLDGAHLRITFDGRTTVDAPIGEFFGTGLGKYDVMNLMSSVDGAADGWYTSWWPMPYGAHATVELVNGSGVPVNGAVVEVTSAADSSVGTDLRTGTIGYFNATHRRGVPATGSDYTFLDTAGTGVFYGVTHSMRGLISANSAVADNQPKSLAEVNRRAYLEGDERVFVDGAASPAWHGTGTEDFYESGWYFRDGTTYEMPLAGNPAYELDGDGCANDCTGAYRLMVGDAVSFATGLRFGIEHGPVDDAPADYSSTAYWYGQPAVTLRQTDLVDPTDPAGRSLHGYSAQGETSGQLTSTYEGDDRAVPVTRAVTAATGPIRFTVTVDPGNSGLRLTRTGDQNQAYQSADVFVDGRLAGTWLEPLGNQHSRWLDDSFEIPASLTAGKGSVQVWLNPVGGAPAWSASQYRVLSRVGPA
ncbi:glycoside hydrolase family 172 protein [Gandjariella thermophila]|uniref:DUF2961 domain-containing protein n=1 Tax=Gandjariella thermophila TaxID=1931992 RepID=A0A4D4J3K6_9PSEU|nr:glycoside hydrolase family 172 protein [Gandjariella thermophila]GDY29662.1 hypothetical protein GTS_12950 [Gandjariella thermophila]